MASEATENLELLHPRVHEAKREAILAVVSTRKIISIQDLLDALPWIRWGEIFSILGVCRREGEVVLHRKGFDFKVQMPSSSNSQFYDGIRPSCGGERRIPLNGRVRQLTHS